jgi:hypothetical protein
MRFFADEVRSRRWGEDKPWRPNFWFGLLYDFFSDFGRSTLRPLFWWIVSTLSFAVYYLSWHFALSKSANLTSAWDWSWNAVKAKLSALIPGLAHSAPQPLSCIPGSNALIDSQSNPLWAALYLALKKGFIISLDQSDKLLQTHACLFGVYDEKSSFGAIAAQQLIPIVPDQVVFVGICQSMISAALIFLFLLALRNQFKIR